MNIMNNNDINNDKINRELYNILYNKSYFMINWIEGAVLPEDHPNYFDGRIDVKITKQFDNFSGYIKINRNEYEITKEIVNSIYNYIDNNIDEIIRIALNQNNETYDGIADSLDIKYKCLYLSISESNATNEDDFNQIHNIKNDIKNILISNK